MGIKYLIFQTRLQGESSFFGRVILKGTLDQSAMVERMLNMGKSLTKPDITAVLQLATMAIGQMVIRFLLVGKSCKHDDSENRTNGRFAGDLTSECATIS